MTEPRAYVDRRNEGAYVVVTQRENIVSIHPTLHEAAKAGADLELPVMFIKWNETTIHDPSSAEFFATRGGR